MRRLPCEDRSNAFRHRLIDIPQVRSERRYASRWKISGYDAVYVALAALSDGVWLTADARAARRVGRAHLVRVLGS